MQENPFTPKQVAGWFRRHKRGRWYPPAERCRDLAEALCGLQMLMKMATPADTESGAAHCLQEVVRKASALREEAHRLRRLSHGAMRIGTPEAVELWGDLDELDRGLAHFIKWNRKVSPDQTPALALELAKLAAVALTRDGLKAPSLKEREGPVTAFVAVALTELLGGVWSADSVGALLARREKPQTPA